MEDSTWRQHPVCTDYEVAPDGRVRSVDRYGPDRRGGLRRVKGRVLKLNIKANGYYGGTVMVAGKRTHVWAHTMVAETYLGPRPGTGYEVRHRNGNPLDNRVENLEWGTKAQNARDRERHGRNRNATKTHCPRKHEYTPENTHIQITKEGWRLRSCRECILMHERNRSHRRKKAA